MQLPLALAIIEDQTAVREALAAYLCGQPEFACVLTAGSIEDFLRRLPPSLGGPVLVLSDIGLPGRSGIEGLPLIRQVLPEAQVLMLSVYTDSARVFEAICAGAVGYLVKTMPVQQLKENLLDVAAGGSPMSPGVARHVIQAFQRQPSVLASAEPAHRLTHREQEIVLALQEGMSYKLVADRLCLCIEEVKSHIRAVYRKLELNARGELLAQALRRQREA